MNSLSIPLDLWPIITSFLPNPFSLFRCCKRFYHFFQNHPILRYRIIRAHFSKLNRFESGSIRYLRKYADPAFLDFYMGDLQQPGQIFFPLGHPLLPRMAEKYLNRLQINKHNLLYFDDPEKYGKLLDDREISIKTACQARALRLVLHFILRGCFEPNMTREKDPRLLNRILKFPGLVEVWEEWYLRQTRVVVQHFVRFNSIGIPLSWAPDVFMWAAEKGFLNELKLDRRIASRLSSNHYRTYLPRANVIENFDFGLHSGLFDHCQQKQLRPFAYQDVQMTRSYLLRYPGARLPRLFYHYRYLRTQEQFDLLTSYFQEHPFDQIKVYDMSFGAYCFCRINSIEIQFQSERPILGLVENQAEIEAKYQLQMEHIIRCFSDKTLRISVDWELTLEFAWNPRSIKGILDLDPLNLQLALHQIYSRNVAQILQPLGMYLLRKAMVAHPDALFALDYLMKTSFLNLLPSHPRICFKRKEIMYIGNKILFLNAQIREAVKYILLLNNKKDSRLLHEEKMKLDDLAELACRVRTAMLSLN